MDQRGQISVEFVLLAAIIMLVVIAFGVVIVNESELNSVASAVKIGAENGTTYASIINPNIQPVRVTSVEMNKINDTDDINITVNFSNSVDSIRDSILTSIKNSLNSSGYPTEYTGGGTLNLETNRHKYTITLA